MSAIEHTVDQLMAMGYLKFTPPSDHAAARTEMAEALARGYLDTRWDSNCVSRDRRSYSADSEELAEGNIGELIRSMREVLQAEGVHLEAVDDHCEEDRYEVQINGRRHQIYNPRTADLAGDWDHATRRALEIVNELLVQAGSKERLYAIYGGNDGRVILLTEPMHELLKNADLKIDPRWLPYPSTAIPDPSSPLAQGQAIPRWKRNLFLGFFLVLFVVGCVSLLVKLLSKL